jgi:diguanylate cyclase (GGDEF)-like protein/PAS domain S-box-containing protein
MDSLLNDSSALSLKYNRLIKEDELWQSTLQLAMDIVAKHGQRAMNVGRCSIWLYSDDFKTLTCSSLAASHPEPLHQLVLNAADHPIYFAALETDRCIAAHDALNDMRTQSFAETYLRSRQIYALLDATLRREGAASGVICFENLNQPREWTDSEIHFASSMADLLSQLIMFYSLRSSELRYRTVFDSTGDALVILSQGTVFDCNAAALRLFRSNRQQFLGQPIEKLWPAELSRTGKTYERFEYEQTRWDNTRFHADVNLTHTKLDQQDYLIASIRDITDRKQATDSLKALNSLHQAIFDSTNYCMIATRLDGIIHTFNRSAEMNLLYEARDLIGQKTPIIFHSERELNWRADVLSRELGYELPPNFEVLVARARQGLIDECEWLYQRQDGSQYPVALAVAPLRDDQHELCGFLFMAADITERKRANDALIESKREMERRANHDLLTGLPNRARLHDVTSIAILNAEKAKAKVALMLLDLNRFKDINDTLGHAIGDHILRHIAKHLQPMLVRHGAYLYRLGGDEFAVLLAKVDNSGEAISLASFIDASLRKPIEVDGITLEIGGSIGIALYPDHGNNSHALLRCADVAMYQAKANAEPMMFYDSNLDAHSPRRLMLTAELGNAVRKDELLLHYQPKVDIATGVCSGCEALIRWQHPKLGLVPPSDFIPMAEMTEVIKPLSEWVLCNALKQTKTWHERGLPIKVSINLSARNLLDHDFPVLVQRHLTALAFPPEYLEIEITESALIGDPERSLAIISRIHDLGVRFAIDDFGTGYSSLAYLKRLPLSTLKIDRTFVRDILNDEQDATIVRSTIALAHSFGLKVVAEGVEDAATTQVLAHMACESAQGYFYAKPLDAIAFETWFREQNGLNKIATPLITR